MVDLSLPPGVSGAPRGHITLTIDEIIWSSDAQPVPCGVKVTWWGQENVDSIVFSPVDVRNFSHGGVGSTQVVTYTVTTSENKFVAYLTDASPLNLEVLDKTGALLGKVLVQDLARIVKLKQLDGYYPVLGHRAAVVANLHVRIVFGEVVETRQAVPPRRIHLKESQQIRRDGGQKEMRNRGQKEMRDGGQKEMMRKDGGKKVVIRSRSKERLNQISPAKVRSCLTPTQSPRVNKKNQRNRVTFSENDKVYNHEGGKEKSNDGFEENVDILSKANYNSEDREEDEGVRNHTPISDNLVADLLNQSQVLRETLRQQLKENDLFEQQEKHGQKALNIDNIETPSDDELLTIEYDMSPMESDDEASNILDNSPLQPKYQIQTVPNQPKKTSGESYNRAANLQSKNLADKENIGPNVARSPDIDQPHLTWNLTVSRLKFLSQTNQVTVSLSGVKVNSSVLESIKLANVTKPSFVPAAGAQAKNRREGKQPAVSVFVKYSLPGDKAENNVCSRKSINGVFQFKEKSLHPVIFNTQVLDLWWTSDIHLKLYSRLLSQRVPFYLGETVLGLKYLLMHDKYSNGSVLSLPVYASQSLFKTLKMEPNTSEIIGHIEVSFLLGTGTKFLNRPVSPQKPVRDFNSAKDRNDGGLSSGVISDLEKLKRNGFVSSREVNLNNNNDRDLIKETFSENVERSDTGRVTLESSVKGSPVIFSEAVLCHLKVSPSSVIGGSGDCLVKCRMFDRKEVSSSLGSSLNVTEALFLPGEVGKTHNRRMLERLKDNYLMVELWRRRKDEDDLLGLGKVPTDAIYRKYQSGQLGEVCEAFDDMVEVVDVIEGRIVGEIKVMLSAGTHRQIAEVKRKEQEKERNDREVLNQTEAVEDTLNQTEAVQGILNETITLEDEGDNVEDIVEVNEDLEKIVEMTDGYDTPASTDYSARGEDSIESTPRNEVPVSDVINIEDDKSSENNHIRVQISIEEARNLPLVLKDDQRVPPTCYTSLPEQAGGGVTHLVKSQSPSWGYNIETLLDTQLLLDPRRHLILKVWHHQGEGRGPDPLSDQVLGFAAVDLAPLLSSFPRINGWYNIMNWVGKCRGQIKVSVTPLVDLNQFQPPSYDRRLSYNPMEFTNPLSHTFSVSAEYSKFPSHVVQNTEQLITSSFIPNSRLHPRPDQVIPPPLSHSGLVTQSLPVHTSPPNPTKTETLNFWKPPTVQNFLPDDPTRSFLEASLKRNLSDLSTISKNIQNRLYPPETNLATQLDDEPLERRDNVDEPLEHRDNVDEGESDSCHTYTVSNPKYPLSMSFLQNHISDNLETLRQLTIGGGEDTNLDEEIQLDQSSPLQDITPQQFLPILNQQFLPNVQLQQEHHLQPRQELHLQVPPQQELQLLQDTQQPPSISSSSSSSDHIPRLALPHQLPLNVPTHVGWTGASHLDQVGWTGVPHQVGCSGVPHLDGMTPSLTDLGGDIDWGEMLNTDTSRVGPEGGNTETEVVSVIRPIQKEKE